MAHFLYRLGTVIARRRWFVLAAWIILVALVGFLIKTLGGNTSNNLDLPGTGSQEASDLLAERFPPQQNGKNPILFEATSGTVESPANKQAIQESRKAIVALPHVVSAPGPYGKEGAAQVSKDKRIAFVPVLLSIGNEELTEEIAQRFLDAAQPARDAGMRVAAGGQIGTELSEPATESSERVGIAAAMVILTFTFGTLVAMGLPIVSAAVALIVGLSVIGLLGNVTEVPSIAPTLATMIGLGVGIDYALFLVIRYRAERAAGLGTEEAVATAVATSGTAIVFAGSTVVLALVTLLVAGIPLVTSLGYASAVAVITAVLGAITLLPAILAILGRRIDSLALPTFLHRPEAAAVPAAGAAGLTGIRGRWARFVVRHPWRCVGIALLILVPLIVPFLSLQLGQEDVGATPPDTTERQAYDLLTRGFGVGFNGPLLVAVELGSPAKPWVTYSWAPTAGLSNARIANPTATQPGTYTVTASGDPSTGITDTDSVTVTVLSAPTPAITPDPATYCAGLAPLVLDAGAGYASYLWSPGGETTATLSVSPTTSTTYTVTVTNAGGCPGSDTQRVDVVMAARAQGSVTPALQCVASPPPTVFNAISTSVPPAGSSLQHGWSLVGSPVGWSIASPTAASTTISAAAGAAATATVRLTVTTLPGGCISTVDFPIGLLPSGSAADLANSLRARKTVADVELSWTANGAARYDAYRVLAKTAIPGIFGTAVIGTVAAPATTMSVTPAASLEYYQAQGACP